MIKVEFLTYNFSNCKFVHKKFLADIAKKVIQKELKKINPFVKQAYVSLILLNKEESLKLNKKWRKKAYIPEDLSFPQFSKGDLKKSQESSIILGDIFVTPELVKGKIHYKKILVHSLLHLLGYDHKNDKDSKKMEEIEQTF